MHTCLIVFLFTDNILFNNLDDLSEFTKYNLLYKQGDNRNINDQYNNS